MVAAIQSERGQLLRYKPQKGKKYKLMNLQTACKTRSLKGSKLKISANNCMQNVTLNETNSLRPQTCRNIQQIFSSEWKKLTSHWKKTTGKWNQIDQDRNTRVVVGRDKREGGFRLVQIREGRRTVRKWCPEAANSRRKQSKTKQNAAFKAEQSTSKFKT